MLLSCDVKVATRRPGYIHATVGIDGRAGKGVVVKGGFNRPCRACWSKRTAARFPVTSTRSVKG